MAETKKTTKTKKTVDNKKSPKKSIFWFIWSLFWKSTLVLIALLTIMGIYFDKKVDRKLGGSAWTLPAKVYARPLLLEPQQLITQRMLIAELKLLNYRPVEIVHSAGQFSVNGNHVELFRRSFDFPEGIELEEKITLSFVHNRIASLKNNRGLDLLRFKLDPLLLSRLHSDQIEDRVFVPFEKIPDLFIDTLLLMEDRNYYHHQGVSPFAIARAFVVNFKAGYTVQGGSTLTQQLAKNLFLTQKRSLWRKFQEAYIAILMDYKYSKDKILEAYLNEVYLAQNGQSAVYGIGLASDFYFSRPINELRIEQIALLVAIIKGPSYYNPRRNPERAMKRRDLVLRLMVEKGLINSKDYQYAVAGPLRLSKKSALNHRANPAFISFLHRELQQLVASSVRKQSGLHIFTSIDPVAQKNAEFAVQKGLDKVDKNNKKSLQGAMVISSRKGAELRAIVSGRDVQFSGFNRALDAVRPIGSLVKPAVYLTALEAGYDLNETLNDKPIILKNSTGQRWSPKNYDRKFRGQVSFEEALYKSLNVPTVNLGMQVGLGNVITSLYKLGIKQNIKAYPSLVLGSVSLSPFEVAQMYQPITMQGRYQSLQMIRTIASNEGELLYKRNNHSEQRFSPEAIELLTDTLHKVTTEGTARSLRWRNSGQRFAGKTGTTNNLKDSWFVGFDEQELVTTWVGRDDNKSAKLTGSSGALVLFSTYMKQKN